MPEMSRLHSPAFQAIFRQIAILFRLNECVSGRHYHFDQHGRRDAETLYASRRGTVFPANNSSILALMAKAIIDARARRRRRNTCSLTALMRAPPPLSHEIHARVAALAYEAACRRMTPLGRCATPGHAASNFMPICNDGDGLR